MSLTQKNITTFEVLNSITNDIDDQKYDSVKLFSFIEFLNYAKAVTNSVINFDQYTIYIKNWNEKIKQNNDSTFSDTQNQFLNLLTEIKIKYTSAEEKKYISNLDVNNPENLEIIIPFFARKIKEICLYFANKKKTFNKNLSFVSQKGNVQSIEEVIKDTVISLFSTDDNSLNLTTTQSLSSIIRDLVIEVERQYDVFNDYYDLDPNKTPDFYNATGKRKQYFTSNTNNIVSEYFFDIDTAIRKLISSKVITLKELTSLAVNINSTELSYLDITDTIDYTQPTRTNLKYNIDVELVKNYIGTDFYYVSSNSLGEVLSGKLFSNGKYHRNLLNIFNPSTLTVDNDEILTERQIGLFFKPTYQGIIKMDSHFDYFIDKSQIESNKIYVFPDPSKYGNISNTSKTQNYIPLTFILDDASVARNISTSFGSNLPKTYVGTQQFTSYTALENKNFIPDYSGNFNSIEQFTDKGDIYSKDTDIFGNIFISFAQDSYFKQDVEGSFIGGTPSNLNFNNTTTQFTTETPDGKETLSFKQLSTKNYFIIDITTENVTPLSGGFENVFKKYVGNSVLYEQLNNSVLDLAMFGNVYFIKTLNYVVIDRFTYDTKLKATGDIPVILEYNRQPSVGADITAITNPYRVGDDIYYIKLETKNNVNTKYVIHSIYKYNLKTATRFTILDNRTTNESTFAEIFTFDSMTTNIVKIRQSKLIFNTKTNAFCLVTNYVDLNFMPLIHVLIFRIKNSELSIFTNRYFSPLNHNVTENFYTENVLSSDFATQTIVSTPTQTFTDGTINF
jgi:hypothetical protein